MNRREFLKSAACVAFAGGALPVFAGAEPKPMRAIISFDDALKDHLLIAAPELEVRGWRGVFNVVTDWVGRSEKFLTWDDVAELIRRGHEVTTHTKSHLNMEALAQKGQLDRVRSELRLSCDEIAAKTGFMPRYYCSPYMTQNETTGQIALEEGLVQLPAVRVNFGVDDCVPNRANSAARAVYEWKRLLGAERLDFLHHGVSEEDHGGWHSIKTRKDFCDHLDEIARLEREGKIIITDCDGFVSDCLLKAADWPRHGVLSFSFDDRGFEDWYRADPIFRRYGLRPTFCVCGEMNAPALNFACWAKTRGYEIALHGRQHLNADAEVERVGAAPYLLDEVDLQIADLSAAGMRPTAFAYPNCRRSEASDAALQSRLFTRLRGNLHRGPTPNPYDKDGTKRAQWRTVADCDHIFTRAADFFREPVVHGVIVGEAYHNDFADILAAIERAGSRAEALCLISHGISPDAHGVSIKSSWLEAILASANTAGVVLRGLR